MSAETTADEEDFLPEKDRSRFGEYLSTGFRCYFDQAPVWIGLIAVAAGLELSAALACVFPLFLISGPLTAGLHYCGLLSVRGKKLEIGSLWHGKRRAGTTMIAWLALQFMQVAPALLLYGLFVGGFFAMMSSGALFVPPPRFAPPPAPVINADGEVAAADTEQAGSEAGDGLVADQPDMGNPAAPAAGPGGRVGRPAGPSPREMQVVASIFAMYGLMFVGMAAAFVFSMWFGVKTMYVFPLIVDRDCSFFEALQESWRLTQHRFWEMLFLYALTAIMAGIGANFCYVGLLFTLPIYFTVIAAAYEGHALPQFSPPEEEVAETVAVVEDRE